MAKYRLVRLVDPDPIKNPLKLHWGTVVEKDGEIVFGPSGWDSCEYWIEDNAHDVEKPEDVDYSRNNVRYMPENSLPMQEYVHPKWRGQSGR